MGNLRCPVKRCGDRGNEKVLLYWRLELSFVEMQAHSVNGRSKFLIISRD